MRQADVGHYIVLKRFVPSTPGPANVLVRDMINSECTQPTTIRTFDSWSRAR